MKKILFAFMLLSLLVSVTHAGLAPSILPTSSHYQGQQSRSFDLGSEGVLDIRLEFAVYADDEAATMRDMTQYGGDPENAAFVYAYQIFCDTSSTAELTYFALTGIIPSTIASVDTDISQIGSMTSPNSTIFNSEGVGPSPGYFNDSKTKGIWEFEGGTMIQGEQSWFLFLYSDYDWIAGDIEVQPVSSDIPIPGVPEPTTLALLACGTILSLRRKK